MVHAHFLQMGGFHLVCTQDDIVKGPIGTGPTEYGISSIVRPNRKYLIHYQFSFRPRDQPGQLIESVIGLETFRELLRQRLIDFPEISKEDINDKSKGDILSKGVAVIQIGWFLIQLIARAHNNLAITELELTTAALAALNIAMYFWWWDKPQDVRSPVVIRTKEAERILANAYKVVSDWELDPEYDFESFRLRYYLKGLFLTNLDTMAQTLMHVRKAFFNTPRSIRDICSLIAQSTRSAWVRALTLVTLVYSRSNRVDTTLEVEEISRSRGFIRLQCLYARGQAEAVLVFLLSSIWNLPIKLFIILRTPMFVVVRGIISPPPTRLLANLPIEAFGTAKYRITNKPLIQVFFSEDDMAWIMSMMFYSEWVDKSPLYYASAIGGAIFGSIHFFAWHSSFPSQMEKTCWWTASISIVGICTCAVPGYFIYGSFTRLRDTFSSAQQIYQGSLSVLKLVCKFLVYLIYPFARIMLLAIAISSLRALPTTALDTVQWIELFPHI